MGYHVLLGQSGKVVHHYVEEIEKLAELAIDGNTLIYEGEEGWKPVHAGESSKYKKFINENREIGILAESYFVKDAIERGYIIEPINQDVDSFKPYKNAGIPIKRGDFLIRNARNLEIEIKCYSIYPTKGDGLCFYFLKVDFEKHLNMAKITKEPIVVVIYQREVERDQHLLSGDIYSFEVEKLPISDLKITRRNGVVSYVIPIKYTEEGFSIIDRYLEERKR